MFNRYSKVDGIFFSGCTDCVFEFKMRNNHIFEYDSTTFIEREKYISLLDAASIIDGKALYIVDYPECVLVYDVTAIRNISFRNLNLPNSTLRGRTKPVPKSIADLSLYDADFVISKTSTGYIRRSAEALKQFIIKNKNNMIVSNLS